MRKRPYEQGLSQQEATFSFLMSSERSGSNLLARLMDAHPAVCSPAPSQLFRFLAIHSFRYGDLKREDCWTTLIEDAARLLAAQHGVWQLDLTETEIGQRTSERTLAALLAAIYRAEASSHGKHRVFVKENHAHEFFGFLEASFSRSKYLYLIRDPRDMALSWKNTAGLRGGVVRAAREWIEDQRGFLRMAGWLAASDRVLTLRYETLVREPETTLRKICSFLDLDYSPSMLTFHEQDLTQRNAARVTAWNNLGRPVIRDKVGRFREDLSASEIRFVESLCASEMEVFGYPPEFDDGESDMSQLESELVPLEPVEKQAYKKLPATERGSLARFREALAAIGDRAPALEVL